MAMDSQQRFSRVIQPSSISPAAEMMKKKTVITTETREVWVFHQPLETSQERDDETGRTREDKGSLDVPAEQQQPEDNAHLENE